MSDDFHCRTHASARRYAYVLLQSPGGTPWPCLVSARRLDDGARWLWLFFPARERARFEAELVAARQSAHGLARELAEARLAQTVIRASVPGTVLVRSVEPVLRAMEQDQEEAAWCLGASPRQTLLRVVLPQLMPAILSGVAQGYSRAVGEYGSLVMISSNVPFKDLITPTLIIQKLEEYDFASATVIGMVMLGFSLLSLLVINGLQVWGRHWEANPMVGG
jgi:sulfate transport system permease protein